MTQSPTKWIRAGAPLLALLLGVWACEEAGAPPPSETSSEPSGSPQTEVEVDVAVEEVPEPPADPGSVPPDQMRGIYLNAWAAGSLRRSTELIELAQRTEINTFVVDIKDATGFVSYPTQVPLAREIGADGELRIRDPQELLRRLREAGIHPVARIVVFKDPLLAGARPDLAVQDSTAGVWIDGMGDAWVNPYRKEVWDYNIALAREAVELGFAEIQWDYVRFPDRPESEMKEAVFPGHELGSRADAVRSFLLHGREGLSDLPARIQADLFGVTTTFRHDVGIGQVWEKMADAVDAVLPMIYPSHYWEGSYGFTQPNAFPYEVVRQAMVDGLERSTQMEGAGVLIPWLQDFTLGEPPYGPPEVRAQIQAVYDAGVQEWILWNASARYTEEALLPAEWGEEGEPDPLIRVAGRVVPTSRRWELPEVGEGAPEVETETPVSQEGGTEPPP